ncbi:TPA: hypothetical protein ACMDVO_003661 [Vibrio cholerae]|uniref:hypothetical protein n=1 Tax=Vibrio cholerae TaxID=666 RepID=UPI00301618A1
MDDLSSAMDSFKTGLSLLGDSIGLIKKVKDLLPDSNEKEAISKSLIEADKAAKLAESQIALALGYRLCKCTFPPQIMLSKGYKDLGYHHEEEFVCLKCNKSSIEPPSKQIDYRY